MPYRDFVKTGNTIGEPEERAWQEGGASSTGQTIDRIVCCCIVTMQQAGSGKIEIPRQGHRDQDLGIADIAL